MTWHSVLPWRAYTSVCIPRRRGGSRYRSPAGWAFLTFVTYNGYWAFVAAALTHHVLRAWPSWKSLVLRAVGGLVGLVGSFLLLLLVASFMQVD